MGIGMRIEEADLMYGDRIVPLEDTHGGLHWLTEGMDPYEIFLIDDAGQQTQIHITDLVARPLTMWRLDSNSLLQVQEYWDDWQEFGKLGVRFH